VPTLRLPAPKGKHWVAHGRANNVQHGRSAVERREPAVHSEDKVIGGIMADGMNLNLDSSAMQTIVAAAIMQQVGPDKRDEIMTAAVKFLLTPPPKSGGYYGPDPKSPLQQAFENAAEVCARRIMHEEMAKPEYAEKVREVVQAAMARAFEGDAREKMIQRMTAALVTSISAKDE
jgi:hypothetical protein